MRTLIFASLATVSLLGSAFDASAITITCDQARDMKSLTADEPVTVVFKNGTKSTITAFWLNYEGVATRYWTLEPGKTQSQKTFVSHIWGFFDVAAGRCLEAYLPEATENAHTIHD